MKIFQISDLHITSEFEFEKYSEMIKKMVYSIKKEAENEDRIYIICCGDIIDKGKSDAYNDKAKSFFDNFIGGITEKPVEMIFVPGNHDLCDSRFTSFQNFITSYNSKINFESNHVIRYETPSIDYLLINTCYHKDWTYGDIDLDSLKVEKGIDSKPMMVVMHHTLMSRYKNDRSAINNAYGFLEALENYNVVGVLHGHTHGFSNISIGKGCQIIGVGSMFEYMPSCNYQFNVIDIQIDKIEQVVNYRYYVDLNRFQSETLFRNNHNNYFGGTKISQIYNQVRNSVKYRGGINNLYVYLESDLDEYKQDMKDNFSDDIESAKLWLEEQVPDSLYYNHGSYMSSSEIKGINYIIEELQRNSTSNRAIIPLICFRDVIENQFNYLPGLNCIQFGFVNDKKTELYCSIYLRSLEVNCFLKINMSEAYLLILQICDAIRSVNRVKINLYAFKAQYKEKFSCFRKARIDTLEPGDFANILYNRQIKEIMELLKEKFEMEETVVNTSGLELFYNILNKSNLYKEQYVDQLANLISDMKQLKEEYLKNSDYHTIEPMEKEIHDRQKKYIELYEEII